MEKILQRYCSPFKGSHVANQVLNLALQSIICIDSGNSLGIVCCLSRIGFRSNSGFSGRGFYI